MAGNAASDGAGGQPPALATLIDAGFAALPPRPTRGYIGASSVGFPCDARLALGLRAFPEDPPTPRQLRIFRDGHNIEATVIADLQLSGLTVLDHDPATYEQWEWTAYGGHVRAHADGKIVWDGALALLEVKSMNADSAKKLAAKGVRVSHPIYYDQMQLLMGLSGIERCLFAAYNKNTSEYSHELVAFDPFVYAALRAKIERVLGGEARRVADDPGKWTCSGCPQRTSCWAPGITVARQCRTCAHAVPVIDMDRWWWCERHDHGAVAACADWTIYRPGDKR